jgi:hypothetical protein
MYAAQRISTAAATYATSVCDRRNLRRSHRFVCIEKAAEHYRAFIELWKSADPELQPRMAEARRRLAKLTPVEKPR